MNDFTRPVRPVFTRTRVAAFSGGWAGVLWGWALSLGFSVVLLLCGCITVPPVVQTGPDRPWLAKPPEMAAARPIVPPPPPMTKAVFGCYLEPTAVPGYLVMFEGQRNGSTNWLTLTNLPYPMAGGYLYYTNALNSFTTLFVRGSYYMTRPPPGAYSAYVP